MTSFEIYGDRSPANEDPPTKPTSESKPRMHALAPKPQLVTRFLHTGPALSDYNSIVPITTTAATTNLATSATAQTSTATTGSKPIVPTVCSAFESHENERLEKAWIQLSENQQKLAKIQYCTRKAHLANSGKSSPAPTVQSSGSLNNPASKGKQTGSSTPSTQKSM